MRSCRLHHIRAESLHCAVCSLVRNNIIIIMRLRFTYIRVGHHHLRIDKPRSVLMENIYILMKFMHRWDTSNWLNSIPISLLYQRLWDDWIFRLVEKGWQYCHVRAHSYANAIRFSFDSWDTIIIIICMHFFLALCLSLNGGQNSVVLGDEWIHEIHAVLCNLQWVLSTHIFFALKDHNLLNVHFVV